MRRENQMRLPTKSGLAMAAILAASFGYTSVTQAAPLAGVAAAVPAVQMTQESSALEVLPEKTHYTGKAHHHHKGKYHHHHHHHHK